MHFILAQEEEVEAKPAAEEKPAAVPETVDELGEGEKPMVFITILMVVGIILTAGIITAVSRKKKRFKSPPPLPNRPAQPAQNYQPQQPRGAPAQPIQPAQMPPKTSAGTQFELPKL